MPSPLPVTSVLDTISKYLHRFWFFDPIAVRFLELRFHKSINPFNHIVLYFKKASACSSKCMICIWDYISILFLFHEINCAFIVNPSFRATSVTKIPWPFFSLLYSLLSSIISESYSNIYFWSSSVIILSSQDWLLKHKKLTNCCYKLLPFHVVLNLINPC